MATIFIGQQASAGGIDHKNFTQGRVGIGFIKAAATIQRVRVRGQVDAAWLAARGNR